MSEKMTVPPEAYRWDDEIEGPAWLSDPDLAERILADSLRTYWFKKLTGYFDRRNSACDALKTIKPDCARKDWIRVGAALKNEFGEEGWPIWNSWSRRGQKYPGESDLRHQWDSFSGHANPVTLGTILHLAREASRG